MGKLKSKCPFTRSGNGNGKPFSGKDSHLEWELDPFNPGPGLGNISHFSLRVNEHEKRNLALLHSNILKYIFLVEMN